MPDDELDGIGGHPSLTSNLDDNDEFLPSTSANAISSDKALSKFQDDDEDDEDEFTSSLMKAAQGKKIVKLFFANFMPIFEAEVDFTNFPFQFR